MSRTIFALLVIGVLFSMTTAQHECPKNQEWTTCGSACPPSCSQNNGPCTLQCVIGCQCKQGFLLNSAGQCVAPHAC